MRSFQKASGFTQQSAAGEAHSFVMITISSVLMLIAY